MAPRELWLPWADAWREALYGGSGFYRSSSGPAGSFATAAQGLPLVGEVLASALVRWVRQEQLTMFVDMGCGRGELVTLVHQQAPDLLCVGVDVVPRPPGLPTSIGWVQGEGGGAVPDLDPVAGTRSDAGNGTDTFTAGRAALVFANEWLDVVPCTIAEVDRRGVARVVEVQPASGEERLGDPLSPADHAWCEAHWPTSGLRAGDRVEVGRSRDEAWRSLADRLRGLGQGVVVAADYGHTAGARPRTGTLTGYQRGRQVRPVPDGSCDVTAHVAMDSLGADEVLDQRALLRGLGVRGDLPQRDLARGDPAAYLHGLARSSAEATLIARGGLGDFLWAVSRFVPRSDPRAGRRPG